MDNKKILPTGESDFKAVVKDCYYVDKTLLIKELLEKGREVNLITRPRRFGKSLNMDMIKTFFEKTEENTAEYFYDKKIWQEEECRKEQGRYPVIYLTLADADQDGWEDTYASIIGIISEEFKRHAELRESDKVDKDDLDTFNLICSGRAEPRYYRSALKLLSRMLYDHHGIEPVILIDEYDVPIQAGYEKRYYGKAVEFVKSFFLNGLKTNHDFRLAYLTGVTKVSEESIFSGLNNLNVYSILDDDFSEYFGFTREEVMGILAYYDCEDKMGELEDWYDGYDFGGRAMFNPWSVMKYVKTRCTPKSYWVNTSENGVIGGLLKRATENTVNGLAALIDGKSISCLVNENMVYSKLRNNGDNAFTLLFYSGYLKYAGMDPEDPMGRRRLLRIPNREVREEFEHEILTELQSGSDILEDIWKAVEAADACKLEEKLTEYMKSSMSVFDKNNEAFYHGMYLGMCACRNGLYHVDSNRESGEGRSDIILEPREKGAGLPALIFEFKNLDRKSKPADMEAKAREALSQIDRMEYDRGLKARGFTDIRKFGFAFSGKCVKVAIA